MYSYVNHVRSQNDLEIVNQNKDKNNRLIYKQNLENSYENLYNDKILNLQENSKLQLFKKIKKSYNFEPYLLSQNFEYRQLISKFRISDHCLLIETGRYRKIPRDLRLCTHCDVLDDEFHFFFKCKINEQLRNEFLNENKYNNLNDIDKLKHILNPETKQDTCKLGSFLKNKVTETEGRESLI